VLVDEFLSNVGIIGEEGPIDLRFLRFLSGIIEDVVEGGVVKGCVVKG
jgi:hypothetical protein